MSITLNKTEVKIFDLLMKVVKSKTPNTTLRVAGGWVRDKLLGKESSDIDIAIDTMTGEDFANLLLQCMKEHGIHQLGVTVVEANPEQSKHLATAMVRLFGLPIDFVNLRSETYTDSRIPQMKMGTPQEDALRRDLTINAIFYNINENRVEDLVGGINDLQLKIARTPTDPVQTFLDDPLRILRTVRFAARYNLNLDPSLVSAATKPEIQKAFREKVSHERIWTELVGKNDGDHWKPGALVGENPIKAVLLLKELGLMENIFDPNIEDMKAIDGIPEDMVPWDTSQNNAHHEFTIWNHTLHVFEHLIKRTSTVTKEDSETYIVRNLSALLHDIGKRFKKIQGTNASGFTNYHGHEETSAKIAELVLTRLHAPNRVIERVKKLIDVHLRPHTLQKGEGGKKAMRRFARGFEDLHHSIDLAIADNLGKQSFTDNQIEEEIIKYETLRSQIVESMPTTQGITLTIPRPLSGKDLIAAGFKPGPIMGQILAAIDEALLDNPDLTKQEALDISKTFS